MRTAVFLLASMAPVCLVGCRPKGADSLPESHVVKSPEGTGSPVGVLETFLGRLAAGEYRGAYALVAPSSKRQGDPIANNAALDLASFLKELERPNPYAVPRDGPQVPADIRDKFKGYTLGASRWESGQRFRIMVTFQGGDRDEVLVVHEEGAWYVADPVHIIR